MNRENPYEDIMDVEYPVPGTRPRMSMHERAAQFAPFAALTGYDDIINRTARLNEEGYEAGGEIDFFD